MTVFRDQDDSVWWALELLSSGIQELSGVCWALDESTSPVSPAAKWVKNDLLHSWRDTGFSTSHFASYTELRWLQAAKWLIDNQEKRFDPSLLRLIKVPAPIPFEKYDLIEELSSKGIPVESDVPLSERLKFLANVLSFMQFAVSEEIAKSASMIIVGEEYLDLVEIVVQSMLLKLGNNWDECEHPLVAGKAHYKVLQKILEIPYRRA